MTAGQIGFAVGIERKLSSLDLSWRNSSFCRGGAAFSINSTLQENFYEFDGESRRFTQIVHANLRCSLCGSYFFSGIGSGATGWDADSGPARNSGARGMQFSSDTVVISANENPLGPAQSALTAICSTASLGGRYHFDEYVKTLAVFNEQFDLKKDYSALFPGSSGPLDLALMSNIGPDKPLIYGDPSYEQGPRAADTMKAPKFAVPLTATYAHDVRAMLKAHPSPGAYYIVNPNNPTGTMTPKEDLVWLVNNKPKGSVVIIDEAYHHFSDAESCIDLVRQDKDVIVMRTFSKIYGMRRNTRGPGDCETGSDPKLQQCWRTKPKSGEHLNYKRCRSTRQPTGQRSGAVA